MQFAVGSRDAPLESVYRWSDVAPKAPQPAATKRQALVGVQPVRLAVHQTSPVPRNYRLKRSAIRNGRTLSPSNTGRMTPFRPRPPGLSALPRRLVIIPLKPAYSYLSRGPPQRPAALRVTKKRSRGNIVAPCRKRSAQADVGSSLAGRAFPGCSCEEALNVSQFAFCSGTRPDQTITPVEVASARRRERRAARPRRGERSAGESDGGPRRDRRR